MSLSIGAGPLAGSPAGAFNFDIKGAAPAHRIYFADDARRLRAIVGDHVVLDTTRAKLLYETAIMPVVYAPLEDYALELLTATDSSTHCPFKGDASYFSLTVDGRELPDVLWHYPEPTAAAPWLAGHGALYFERMDAWFVEDERVVGHLRDPFHRVDVHESSRPVVVTVGGQEVARSPRPKLVFETGMPLRAYVPPADVSPGAVAGGSGLRSVCAYKGEASYWSVAGVEDAAWSYEQPTAEATRLAGHLCFDESKDGVEVTLDA